MVLASNEALSRINPSDRLVVSVIAVLHLVDLSTRGKRHQLIAHADAVSGELMLEGILYLSDRLLAASWGARAIADEDTTQSLYLLQRIVPRDTVEGETLVNKRTKNVVLESTIDQSYMTIARTVDARLGARGLSEDEKIEVLQKLSKKYGIIFVMTGEANIAADGNEFVKVSGGSEMLKNIVGSGCMLGGIVAASVSKGLSLKSVKEALECSRDASLLAEKNKKCGPMEFLNAYIDSVHKNREESIWI